MEIAPVGKRRLARRRDTGLLCRSGAERGRKLLIRNQRDHHDERADKQPIQPAGGYSRQRAALGRQLMNPSKDERDRKAEDEQQ